MGDTLSGRPFSGGGVCVSSYARSHPPLSERRHTNHPTQILYPRYVVSVHTCVFRKDGHRHKTRVSFCSNIYTTRRTGYVDKVCIVVVSTWYRCLQVNLFSCRNVFFFSPYRVETFTPSPPLNY